MDNDEQRQAAVEGGPEIEVKLTGTAGALKRAFSSAAVRSRAMGRSRTRHLESIYYDTEDLQLHGHGLSLRVRKDGRRYQQTLKSGDGNGLAAYRGEWELPLHGPEPNLALMPQEALQQLNGAADGAQLHSMFATRIERRLRRIKVTDRAGNDSVVEVALDVGTIEREGASLPIAELELELVEGSPDAIYAAALDLDLSAGLRVESRSKSARGYELATGAAPAWCTAEAPALDSDTTVDAAIGAVLRSCVEHWCANQAAAHDGQDPEGIHQVRVAIRRLRSAFSLFRRLIDPADRTWLSGEAKAVVSGFGPARDWDVFQDELLGPLKDRSADDVGLTWLARAAERERSQGYVLARSTIESPAYARYMLKLRYWIEACGWRRHVTEEGVTWLGRPIGEFAAQVLDKRHRKVLKAGRGFSSLAVEKRHELRIDLKKLRYAAEFFQGLYGRSVAKPYLAVLKDLQDDLGHLNDVAVAERLVGTLARQPEDGPEGTSLQVAGGMVLGWHARGIVDLEPVTRKAWKRFKRQDAFWR